MTSEAKKWLLVCGIVILCFAMIVFADNGFANRLSAENDAKIDRATPVVLSEASDEMPSSSSYGYGVTEYQVLNDVVSEGMVIRQYQRIFKNTARKDYSIESAYKDYLSDMEEYRVNLKQDITMLKSMRPALKDAQYEQVNAVKKVERLYDKISDYKNHAHNLKDTLKYLEECEYELNRVSQQAKLPRERI